MYSLVSAPILGFDLVRRAGGAETATILGTALALGPADLPVLAASVRSDADRLAAWARVGAATRAEERVSDIADSTSRQSPAAAVAGLRRLTTAGIGTLDDLLRCVRHDVLDWSWSAGSGVAVQSEVATAASTVICDAVAGAYAGPLLGTAERTVLCEPWRRIWGTRTPPLVDLGPGAPEVRALLQTVSGLDGTGRRALLGAADAYRAGTRPWALAVHNASWAAHLSGRTRSAAAAQMLAVGAVQRAGFSAHECAAGVWNLVSGAVHAMIVSDLLGDVDHLALTEPLDALKG